MIPSGYSPKRDRPSARRVDCDSDAVAQWAFDARDKDLLPVVAKKIVDIGDPESPVRDGKSQGSTTGSSSVSSSTSCSSSLPLGRTGVSTTIETSTSFSSNAGTDSTHTTSTFSLVSPNALELSIISPSEVRQQGPKFSFRGASFDDSKDNELSSQWAAYVDGKCAYAKRLTSEVQAQTSSNVEANDSIICVSTSRSGSVHDELRKKMASTTGISRAIEDEMRKLEALARLTRHSLASLQRASFNARGPLGVCEGRLALLSKGGGGANNAAMQEALLREQKALNDARQQFAERVHLCSDNLENLDKARQELYEELCRKRLTQKIDHVTLLEGSSHGMGGADRHSSSSRLYTPRPPSPPPRLASSRSSENLASPPMMGTMKLTRQSSTGSLNEKRRLLASREMIEKAALLEETTTKLCKLNGSIIASRKREWTEANDQSVHGVAADRIRNCENISVLIENQMFKTSEIKARLNVSIRVLQRAFSIKWTPLQICQKRLEIRSERPWQQSQWDPFQEALEKEKDALIEARQEISDLVVSIEDTISSLTSIEKELLEELHKKRQSVAFDHSYLLEGVQKGIYPIARRLSSADLSDKQDLDQFDEPSNEYSYNDVMQRAIFAEEHAEQLYRKSDKLQEFLSQKCDKVTEQTNMCMKEHLTELAAGRRRIEEQIANIEKALSPATISLERLTKKVQSHIIPFRALERRFSMQQKRCDSEKIVDRVHEKLEEELQATTTSVHAVARERDKTQALVNELKSAKFQLTEALRVKAANLRIEEACAKVLPKHALSASRQRRPAGNRGRGVA